MKILVNIPLVCFIIFLMLNCTNKGNTKNKITFYPYKKSQNTEQITLQPNFVDMKFFNIYQSNLNLDTKCHENHNFDTISYLTTFKLDGKAEDWSDYNIYIQDAIDEKLDQNSINLNKIYLAKTSTHIVGLIENSTNITLTNHYILLEFGIINNNKDSTKISKLRTYLITQIGIKEYIKHQGWIMLDDDKAKYVLKNNLIEWQIFNRELHEVLLNNIFWIKLSVINKNTFNHEDQSILKFFKYQSNNYFNIHTYSNIKLNKCIITIDKQKTLIIDEIYVPNDDKEDYREDINIDTFFTPARFALYNILNDLDNTAYNFTVLLSSKKIEYVNINSPLWNSIFSQQTYLPLNIISQDVTKNNIFTRDIEKILFDSLVFFYRFIINNFYITKDYYLIDLLATTLTNRFLIEHKLNPILLMYNFEWTNIFLSNSDTLNPIALKTRFNLIEEGSSIFDNQKDYEQYIYLTYAKLKSLAFYLAVYFNKSQITELLYKLGSIDLMDEDSIKNTFIEIANKYKIPIDINNIWNGWLNDTNYDEAYNPQKLLEDTDLDGLINFLETVNESSILDFDTDDDGFSDLTEYVWGYDPVNRQSHPKFIAIDNVFKTLTNILPSHINFVQKDLPSLCPQSSKILSHIAGINKNKIFIAINNDQLFDINQNIIWEAEIFLPVLSKKILLKTTTGRYDFDLLDLSSNKFLGTIFAHTIPYGIYGVEWYLNLDYILQDLELTSNFNLTKESNIKINIQSFYVKDQNQIIFCNNTGYFNPIILN